MYSIGIDSGSVATKGVLFDGKSIINKIILPTGWSPRDSSNKALEFLKEGIKKEDIKEVIGTGYGRVSMDFVSKKVTEITCHAKGIYFLNNKIRTVLDIGGQDSKVIKLDENGNVCDFIMNDKCAAGTGRFLQVMMNLLETDVSQIDNIAKDASPKIISSMCTVFAESEVVSLLAQEASKESIANGILLSISNKACTMLDKINIEKDVAFSGGLANSAVLVSMIEEKIKHKLFVSEYSQIIGALGAAYIGYNK